MVLPARRLAALLLLLAVALVAALARPAAADFYGWWGSRPVYSGGYSQPGAFAPNRFRR